MSCGFKFLISLTAYMLIFHRIFLNNYWWQESDIWSQASYRYPISWEAFLDPSDSYFLFADLVGFYTHWTYTNVCTFFITFFSATIDGRDLIFGHKLHIGTPSDSYFLFAEERGYHKWALAHSSSCIVSTFYILQIIIYKAIIV